MGKGRGPSHGCEVNRCGGHQVTSDKVTRNTRYVTGDVMTLSMDIGGFTKFLLPVGERDRVRGLMKPNFIEKCRKLRKDQTDAERRLWSVLRKKSTIQSKIQKAFFLLVDIY